MKRLTVREFAELKGISRVTVYRYIKQGKLRAERIGGILYVLQPESRDEIELLRAENEELKERVAELEADKAYLLSP